MEPEDLYEVNDGVVHYKGTSEDTMEDHIRKCAPCAEANLKLGEGVLVLHGQRISFKALFKILDPVHDDAQ